MKVTLVWANHVQAHVLKESYLDMLPVAQHNSN